MSMAYRLTPSLVLIAMTTAVALATEPQAATPAAGAAAGIVRIVNQQGNEFSIGSGTLVDCKQIERKQDVGIVLTCAHVFSDGVGDILVFFDSGTPRRAVLIASDDKNDLASLAVEQPGSPAVELATSVPAIGTPLDSCGFGQEGKLRINRGELRGQVTLKDGESEGVVELSGMARQGDSGGPIFDAQHRLVAVIMGSDGDVVDGTHCEVFRPFLAAHPLTPNLLGRLQQLARQSPGDVTVAFRPDYDAINAQAADIPEAPALSTIRGVARYGSRVAAGASIHLSGQADRVAKLDEQGRFQFDAVRRGSYQLTIDAVVRNKLRHGEQSIWISGDLEESEVELILE
jgi:S1-C subfamily serine protease